MEYLLVNGIGFIEGMPVLPKFEEGLMGKVLCILDRPCFLQKISEYFLSQLQEYLTESQFISLFDSSNHQIKTGIVCLVFNSQQYYMKSIMHIYQIWCRQRIFSTQSFPAGEHARGNGTIVYEPTYDGSNT